MKCREVGEIAQLAEGVTSHCVTAAEQLVPGSARVHRQGNAQEQNLLWAVQRGVLEQASAYKSGHQERGIGG